MAKEISLTRGKVAIVDDEDYERLSQYKWRCNSHGYAVRSEWRGAGLLPRFIAMHREVLGADGNVRADHIDGNRLNNQKFNLRECTESQNQMNRGKHVRTSSQYKGVSFFKETSRWRAYIQLEGKGKHLGFFDNEVEAAKAYNVAAKQFYGEFARLNVISDCSSVIPPAGVEGPLD